MLSKSYLILLTIGISFLVFILPVASSTITAEKSIKELQHATCINKNFPQNSNSNIIRQQPQVTLLSDEIMYTSTSLTGYNQLDISYPTVNSMLVGHQWPQQGFNQQHVGRSPYSTAANPGVEKWRFPGKDWCGGSPVIDAQGIIYFGSDFYLYAINPNGTLQWKFKSNKDSFGDYGSHPAIAQDGTIYIASKFGSTVYAVNPDGTEQWHINTPEIDTSITLDDEGVLYYGHWDGVDARYPNGTLKWRFQTEDFVQSTPAIDTNGIIYFGSHDDNIYAVYPNGTMKWKFQTGGWVHGSPTIGSDGTIYCESDDDYLYAFNQNGAQKWKTKIKGSMRSSPSIDKEGNLYFGTSSGIVISIASNGTLRWEVPLREGDGIWGSTAAISDDGTIYIGNGINWDMLGGGEIIALDLGGNLKWRKTICDSSLHSSPVISADGTVYICASNDGSPEAWGYLHAFGAVENNQPPETPTIDGPIEGEVRTSLKYIVKAEDFDNTPVSYYFDWDDGTQTQTVDYEPGIPIPRHHTWNRQGTYTVKVKAIDTFGLESDWAIFEVTMPRNKPMMSLFESRFPRFFNFLWRGL